MGRPPFARVGMIGVTLLLAALVTILEPGIADAASGPLTQVNGTGSSYAGPAFTQWVSDGSSQGLPVNYTPTSSPQGLTEFQSGTVPFAGTEAEFSSLLGVPDASVTGGYQYTPDVAGATAVLYNADDQSGRQINYLHFSQRTVARIFMGYIDNWDSPEISADNHGLVLPNHPITIVYRSGQSGTTALFYDFVAHADPTDFASWAAAHDLPTTTRIIELDNGAPFAPYTDAVSGSDQQAETVAGTPWTISYDEFAYAKTYGDQVAWIENGAGRFTQPYAVNITSALETAQLSPVDLSQNLTNVYASTNPLAYPISAYSYIVTRCNATGPGAPNGPTCGGTYSDPGQANTMGQWMSYIACAGQAPMALIGYAPLPANLSQDLADAVSRITGQPDVTLSASNCANPRESGLLGVGASGPADPYLTLTTSLGTGPGGSATTPAAAASSGNAAKAAAGTPAAAAASAAAAGTTAGAAASTGTTLPGGTTAASSAAGVSPAAGGVAAAGSVSDSVQAGVAVAGGKAAAVGGGTAYRSSAPAVYKRPIPGGLPSAPLEIFLAVLVVPSVLLGLRSGIRRVRR